MTRPAPTDPSSAPAVAQPHNQRDQRCPFRPHPDLTADRDEASLPRVPVPNPQLGQFDGVLVTRYADVRQVLSDPRFEAGFAFDASGPRTVMNQPGILLNYDGAEHSRYRRMLTGAFSVKRVRVLADAIIGIVGRQLDALEWAGRGADLVESFAAPVPLLTICELLGVPWADRDGIRRRSAIGTDVSTTLQEQLDNFADMAEYMGELVAAKRRAVAAESTAGAGDILTDLVRRHGHELDDDELVGMGNSLLVAGHETVTSMIGMSVIALGAHPDQADALRADPALAVSAVEELLRFLSVAPPLVRQATQDVAVGGCPVAAGEKVVASALAANHGPDLLGDGPAGLDLRRAPSAHLAFGYGPHQCIGQQLARVELQIALPALLRRFPRLRPTLPVDRISYRGDALVFGPTHLPVTW
jgi:cytochrome P450